MAKHKRRQRSGGPPEGEPWVWHTHALISSPAWRGRSINCSRVIEFLEMEHLHHGGNENGSLLAPYTQLVAFGITRRLIANVIREAETRGLIRVERGGKKGTLITELSRFRLTYQWTKTRTSGVWDWHEPTDDWKHFTETEIGPTSGTVPAPLRELAPAPLRELAASQVIETARSHVVPLREPPSISWGGGPSQHQGARGGGAHDAKPQARDRESKSIGPVRQHGH